MTQCWSEGELRAYLDGELPARDMDRLARHLAECMGCRLLCAKLEARAAQLSGWMEALEDSTAPLRVPAPPRRAHLGRWTEAAVGVAAALVVAMLLLPKRAPELTAAPRPHTGGFHSLAPPPAAVKPAIIRRGTTPPPKPQIQYYVALDNEPIETGLVVRVELNGGQVPADVIVGPDGRARAIRLVSDFSGEAK
ncbi:MAG TPA: zf-HC2 domain-containing protein [Bryobacteraceae bacterium]|nr:zf-HC2 domain-containing protein [Bryobacteraceae bacterium]